MNVPDLLILCIYFLACLIALIGVFPCYVCDIDKDNNTYPHICQTVVVAADVSDDFSSSFSSLGSGCSSSFVGADVFVWCGDAI